MHALMANGKDSMQEVIQVLKCQACGKNSCLVVERGSNNLPMNCSICSKFDPTYSQPNNTFFVSFCGHFSKNILRIKTLKTKKPLRNEQVLAKATGIDPSASKFWGTEFQTRLGLERLWKRTFLRDFCYLKGAY